MNDIRAFALVALATLSFTCSAQQTGGEATVADSVAKLGGCLMTISVGACIAAAFPADCEAAVDSAKQTCGRTDERSAVLLQRADDQTSQDPAAIRTRAMLSAVKENLMKLGGR